MGAGFVAGDPPHATALMRIPRAIRGRFVPLATSSLIALKTLSIGWSRFGDKLPDERGAKPLRGSRIAALLVGAHEKYGEDEQSDQGECNHTTAVQALHENAFALAVKIGVGNRSP